MTTRDTLRSVAQVTAKHVDEGLWRYLLTRPYVGQAMPDDLERLDAQDFVPEAVPFGTGVDLQESAQLALLNSWEGRFEDLFTVLREDSDINTGALGQAYLHNGFYPTPDAEVYAAMIADRSPSKIIEIGAGFSTRIARRVINETSSKTELIVVDPQPRADVSSYADTVFRQRFEDVDPAALGIEESTVLFVDSSHIIRAGGDVTVIFCRVIPALPPGVLVQVHDIFLPYDYPPAYLYRLFTEAYILWALLARSPGFRVLFATHFMVRTQRPAMQRILGPIVGADNLHFGSSFWFTVS